MLIFNNGFLGMVRQWQELFYEERYSQVELGTAIPDYVKLAEAYGCFGLRCDSADEVDAVLEKALAADRRAGRRGLPGARPRGRVPDGRRPASPTTRSCWAPSSAPTSSARPPRPAK